jgi:hypothetical protein
MKVWVPVAEYDCEGAARPEIAFATEEAARAYVKAFPEEFRGDDLYMAEIDVMTDAAVNRAIRRKQILAQLNAKAKRGAK